MTSSHIESESFPDFHKHYHEKVKALSIPFFLKLKSIIRKYLVFNFFFLALGITELFLILFFLIFLAKSSLLALCLAAFFLTAFSYFVLKIYFQTKKPEELISLRNSFLHAAKDALHYQSGNLANHLALSQSICKTVEALRGKEKECIEPAWQAFAPLLQKISYKCYWKDLLKIKELLLVAAIEEHMQMIKLDPINLETHASLANIYVTLSSLYSNPNKHNEQEDDLWMLPQDCLTEMQKKFRKAVELAIEEFKILNEYAPDDSWVHTQLAYSYHDLQMPLEEIREYEILLKLQPEDPDTLLKLGMLYFEQGFNAKGLRLYEELQQIHYKKADSLIQFYGSQLPKLCTP